MIPEGLDKRPLNDSLVRLWNTSVVQGIAKKNPFVLSMTHVQVFDSVVRELGIQNVKVLLDNHVSEPKWYMSKAAVSIQKTNPKVLVVIFGLNYDTELQFLKSKPLKIDLVNRICANNIKGIEDRAGFLTTGNNAVPLIFTEFGFNEVGSSMVLDMPSNLSCWERFGMGFMGFSG
ncbi:unnamed protein product [Sphenostylis stenocarpa]|uniref:Glycoside hydrolase family 5 domain-containing protein n=1 Tax=Sphenostylis stenocarpa TaxID=92480 RepID=A0AA86T110_9FABA|nr:unnamed protein product [Sphenostylis stenocarpa]